MKINNISPVFYNECDKTYFDEYGKQLNNQPKGLDEFTVSFLEDAVEVPINRVKYGVCNQNNFNETFCSTISKTKYGKPEQGKQIGKR